MKINTLVFSITFCINQQLPADQATGIGISIKTLVERHAAFAMLKQFSLADKIVGGRWHVDFSRNTIHFSAGISAGIQLLGTESYVSNTWLWAWGNQQKGLPRSLLDDAFNLKRYGRRHNIPWFVQQKFNLSSVSGLKISLIASDLLRRVGFYKGPYTDGAAYFLLTNISKPIQLNSNGVRIIKAVTEITKLFRVNHRKVVNTLMIRLGYAADQGQKKIEYKLKSGNVLRLKYDNDDNIKQIRMLVKEPL